MANGSTSSAAAQAAVVEAVGQTATYGGPRIGSKYGNPWLPMPQQQLGETPHERVHSVRRAFELVCSEGTHLIFEGSESAHVVHAPLLVERGDRFGADRLAPRGPYASIATLRSTVRITRSTMSPPLLISATIRSARCR